MDDRKSSTSPDSRCSGLGSESAPVVDGVWRDTLGADALCPNDVEPGRNDLPSGRKVDTYCFHGDELSQGVAAALRIMGVETHSLQHGIARGTEQGLPTRHNTAASDPH
jgi:hypothetical protein